MIGSKNCRITHLTNLLVLSILFVLSFFQRAFADTLYLKNGRTLEGLIRNETGTSIELDVGFGTVTFEKGAVENIYKSTPEETCKIQEKWQESRSRLELNEERAVEERNKSMLEWRERQAREENENRLREDSKPKHAAVSSGAGQLLVNTLLNNKVNASLVLDTGASLVILSNAIANKLGINIDKQGPVVQLQVADGRKINASYVVLESVKIKDIEAKGVEAAVLPADVKDAKFGDGLLGMSFLSRFNFKCDYKNEQLILEQSR